MYQRQRDQCKLGGFGHGRALDNSWRFHTILFTAAAYCAWILMVQALLSQFDRRSQFSLGSNDALGNVRETL